MDEESPYTDPLNIARGLEQLAKFIGSAGFASAGHLVKLAALAAWKDIARVPAAPDKRGRRKVPAKQSPDSSVIPLDQHRRSGRHGTDGSGDTDDAT